ncbi:MmgE/PrpD family protein [Mycobacterium sp. NPDC003449]
MLTREFAQFAVTQRKNGLPDEVYAAATRAVVDWFGATIAGVELDPARIMTRTLVSAEDTGVCALVAGSRSVDARAAALINGTASHTVEFDDIFRDGIYHPGSPTVAAALAAAQQLDLGGERFLRAVAIGYEIGDRIAAAIQPAHYRFWHTTGTVGAIGAAAAVADLLELDTDSFAHALATATTMAAGLQQAFRSDSMSKPLHAGHAADSGLVAAQLAGGGYTGALDILEGSAGFGAGMSDQPDWPKSVELLGKPWGITAATVKNHACCGHTFAAVDAALELRDQGLDPNLVEAIEIRTYTTATRVAGNPDPSTEFEAKFSLAYCVAAAIWLGSVRLAAFSRENLGHPGIRALLPRVTVIADPEFDVDFPGRRRARVTVRMADGTDRHRQRDTRKGDPDDPLTDDEMRGKFLELAEPVIGERRAEILAEQLWAVRGRGSVRGLGTESEGQS